MELQEKYEKLKAVILETGRAAVAFSGGVDSTLLSKVGYDVLKENSIAITLVSAMNAKSEMQDAEDLAKEIGITHFKIFEDDIADDVLANPVNRCYFCKKRNLPRSLKKQKRRVFNMFLMAPIWMICPIIVLGFRPWES